MDQQSFLDFADNYSPYEIDSFTFNPQLGNAAPGGVPTLAQMTGVTCTRITDEYSAILLQYYMNGAPFNTVVLTWTKADNDGSYAPVATWTFQNVYVASFGSSGGTDNMALTFDSFVLKYATSDSGGSIVPSGFQPVSGGSS